MTTSLYRHDDLGAPVLPGAAGALNLLLEACLVSGYGDKPGAGWTKPFSGGGIAAYRAGAGNRMFLRVDDTGATVARVVGYESMTGVSAGSGSFPSEAQLAGGGYAYKSSDSSAIARPWVISASASHFFLWVATSATGSIAAAGTSAVQFFYFGDILSRKSGDAFNTAIICGSTDSEGGSLTGALAAVNTSLSGHFLARSYTQIGASVLAGKHSDASKLGGGSVTGSGALANPYPDPVTGGILIAPMYVHEPAVMVTRGTLPGVWCVLHNMPGACGDTFSGSGSLAGKLFVLLNAASGSSAGRLALEISDPW